MVLRADADIARELDQVPVFGILLTEDGKLYCEDGSCMVYTQLGDAHRVLAKMQETFPETTLEVMPLSLGHVLQEGGFLGRADATNPAVSPQLPSMQVNLIASPFERRTAKKIREESAAQPALRRTGAAAELQRVPIFHIGAVPSRQAKEEEEPPLIWPFFFRAADVEELWKQLGDGAPQPELHATDLAALIDGLRDVESAPAEPLICGPLDGLAFVRSRDAAVVKLVHYPESRVCEPENEPETSAGVSRLSLMPEP